MRATRWMLGTSGALALAAAYSAGCSNIAGDCDRMLECPSYLTGSSGSSSSTGTGGTGGGGGDGGTMPACEGDPTADKSLVNDKCGVFVSSTAATGGDGTKAKPFTLLSDAVEKARSEGKWVYACAEGYTETATLTIDGALGVYGGFTGCEMKGTAWTWSASKRASYTGPADKIAMLLQSGGGTIHIENVDVTAPNAVTKSASSVAVYADGGTVEFKASDLTAGDAMLGDDGPNASSTPAQAGSDGNNGAASCSADTVNGAAQQKNTCGVDFSIGGNGGNGNDVNGTQGAVGLPNNGGGQAGAGDDGSVGWTCDGNGGTGKNGLPGSSGMEGTAGTDFGMLTTSGFLAAAGGDGQPGTPGQGGGGGGGVRGSALLCAGKPGSGGASGGSGGSGGCGGEGGKGGKGGGASIALVSANATIMLTSVKLNAGNGGSGGRGGNPQAGGAGSKGGSGGTATDANLQAGCNGGNGGAGGPGGPGGGGRGGHSIGIVVLAGSAPTIEPTDVTIKSAGKGGLGGSNDFKMNHGADGAAEKCWDFGKNAACM